MIRQSVQERRFRQNNIQNRIKRRIALAVDVLEGAVSALELPT
jgi:hypothetical protein